MSESKPSSSPFDLYDIDAEQAIIGVLLTQNHFYDLVAEYLTKDDFHDAVNIKVYDAIQSLQEQGEIATYITVRPFFSDHSHKDEVYDYLKKLSLDPWPSTTLSAYVKRVGECAKRRQLLLLGAEVEAQAKNTESIQETINLLEERLYKITEKMSSKVLLPLEKNVEAFLKTIKDNKKGGEKPYIPSSFKDIDRILGGGLSKTDLIILAGRTSMGKTALGINLALNIASNRKKRVCFFSLEMSCEQLSCRILSLFSGVPSHLIRTGHLNDEQEKKVKEAAQKTKSYSLNLDDMPAISLGLLISRARRMKRQEGLDCLVIDYLQLITTDYETRKQGRVMEVGHITGRLKALAKDLGIPIILLSQLSRATEAKERVAMGHRPQLSDLRESGYIEQDADVVMFIYRREYYLTMQQPEEGTREHAQWQQKMEECNGLAEVIVAKHRHGSTGNAMLRFYKDTTRFRDYEPPSSRKR